MLSKRHREQLAHHEMCSAFTTAAAINSGFARPEEPVSALAFMPNHQAHTAPEPELSEEQQKADNAFELTVLNLKHQLLAAKAAENEPLCRMS